MENFNDNLPHSFSSMHISEKLYRELYLESIRFPDSFWGRMADQHISWYSKWDTVLSGKFSNGSSRWFSGATLNASYNCIDRHLAKSGNKTAILWEGDDPNDIKRITYQELLTNVSKAAIVDERLVAFESL